MKAKNLIIFTALILLIGFNLYLYRAEFKVLVDPNDNIFQYALVDEARNIWKNIFAGKLSPFYLLDSWQERWAEGFALSNYYAHLPQALIGLFGGYKLFVIVRTLMLIFLPLMFFWGGTILRLPSGFNLILVLFSQAIFTDGLYGIDASSFIWRGWGLSAQLMAVFFLPVAFAYAIDYFENKRSLWKAIFFNFLLAQSHFGIFSLLLLGYPLYLLNHFFQDVYSVIASEQSEHDNLKRLLRRFTPRNDNWARFLKPTVIFISLTLFSLSYFIIPFFVQSQYRNFSVWDPIWKFDSWGARQVIVWFLNGELFDFGRFPLITLFVVFGVFAGFAEKNRLMKFFSMLFVVYSILFLGRTTLGGLVDLIPGFSEYHLHRIVVMVQFTGLFLGAWFLYKALCVILTPSTRGKNLVPIKSGHFTLSLDPSVTSLLQDDKKKMLIPSYSGQHDKGINLIVVIGLILVGFLFVYYLEQPLIKYGKDNNTWIERSNKAYLNDLPYYEKIKARLGSLPKARVYVGRPGNWGKNFTVGEIPLYMVLSQDGFPVIGFLPESWSPNSDPEQFFDENSIEFYNLYNVGYSILPDNIKAPDFAKLLLKEAKYNLFQISTTGWFDFGQSNIAVKSKKTSLLNATRLWFESKLFETGDYPLVDLSKDPPDGKRWYIQMTDKNNFINLNDGIERNIWQANPFGDSVTNVARPSNIGTIVVNGQEALVSGYKAKIELKEGCQNCIVVLKQSFHPNWQVRLNGEKVNAFPVFPFYVGIPLEKAGIYEVVAEYKPSSLKVFLVSLELSILAFFIGKKFTEKMRNQP